MALIKLSPNEISSKLPEIPGWEHQDGKLHREFRFTDFVEAFGFMSRTAGHHPEWFSVYNIVRIDLATHEVNGISQADFDLASKINRFESN